PHDPPWCPGPLQRAALCSAASHRARGGPSRSASGAETARRTTRREITILLDQPWQRDERVSRLGDIERGLPRVLMASRKNSAKSDICSGEVDVFSLGQLPADWQVRRGSMGNNR